MRFLSGRLFCLCRGFYEYTATISFPAGSVHDCVKTAMLLKEAVYAGVVAEDAATINFLHRGVILKWPRNRLKQDARRSWRLDSNGRRLHIIRFLLFCVFVIRTFEMSTVFARFRLPLACRTASETGCKKVPYWIREIKKACETK